MIQVGDRVVFTVEHYLWLVGMRRWSHRKGRLNHVGLVVNVADDVVRVLWKDEETVHFACNLEVRQREYGERDKE